MDRSDFFTLFGDKLTFHVLIHSIINWNKQTGDCTPVSVTALINSLNSGCVNERKGLVPCLLPPSPPKSNFPMNNFFIDIVERLNTVCLPNSGLFACRRAPDCLGHRHKWSEKSEEIDVNVTSVDVLDRVIYHATTSRAFNVDVAYLSEWQVGSHWMACNSESWFENLRFIATPVNHIIDNLPLMHPTTYHIRLVTSIVRFTCWRRMCSLHLHLPYDSVRIKQLAMKTSECQHRKNARRPWTQK